jgi:3-polyprenyl-4-hydroxybenzoate decarboxylase
MMLRYYPFSASHPPPSRSQPQSVDDIVDHTVGRAVDLIGVQTSLVMRWKDVERSKVEDEAS